MQPSQKKTQLSDTIVLELKQKDWIKQLIPAADRARLSSNNLYYLLSDLLTTNGIDLKDVIISPATIHRL